MSLIQSTLLTAFLLLLAGGSLLLKPAAVEARAKAFPRSMVAAIIVFGGASAWFLLVHVANLGPADFGEYRKILFAGFAAVALLSFFYVPDFLAVRGVAALTLLFAAEVLQSAYGMPEASRLFLVGFIYLAILLALYLAAVPYRLRDFFDWLFARTNRARIVGSVLAAYGVLLGLTSGVL